MTGALIADIFWLVVWLVVCLALLRLAWPFLGYAIAALVVVAVVFVGMVGIAGALLFGLIAKIAYSLGRRSMPARGMEFRR